MKSLFNFYLTISFVSCLTLISSCVDRPLSEEEQQEAIPAPVFTIGVKPIDSPTQFPYLQSFAWARSGDEILMIGGRTEGFHGLNQLDTVFKTSRSNKDIWLVNFSDMSYKQLSLDLTDPIELQMSYSNTLFYQSGDTLFLSGGYGPSTSTVIQSDTTSDQIMAISISGMISQVQIGGKPSQAVLYHAQSPFVQVAGGEMAYEGGWFYLMFGQNYQGAYTPGKTGNYTSAVRKFRFVDGQVTDTSSVVDTMFHRRDLNVVKIVQKEGDFYGGFGGVFTAQDNGYLNPVYINLSAGVLSGMLDTTLVQKTNQYACAVASIYDPGSDASISVLLGGIGQFQYNPKTGTWEDGDKGAKLPFVKTITQMIWQNGLMTQNIQLPPDAPELPALVGANALFIPDSQLIYDGEIIDYSKIQGDTMRIGLLYGGIKSPMPSSSTLYPTTLNKTIYEVYLYR